jgi:hypothetical protein
MNTFTAQELSDFYQKVADGGESETNLNINQIALEVEWIPTTFGPTLQSSHRDWRIKPTKKVIDLSVLIDGIDCEFKDLENDSWVIGKLHDLPADHDGDFKYWKRQDNSGCWYDKCQPRMNHKHAWDGGECPIEGFVVRVWYNKDTSSVTKTSVDFVDWERVIYVMFLKVEDGYVMPWESEPNTGY